MANPTTNFGWVMPTSTSLVTNLPADFNTFGQGVDTSMAQLKGGTTGQILSKTSATDMAFTWITPNPGDITGVTAGTGISGGGTSGDVTITNSMATAMTTKGDLVPATGSGTFSRLAVGTNGQTLVADSSTSTGLAWSTPSSGGMTLLSTTTTNTGSAYTISSLSTSYNALYLIWEGLSCTAGSSITIGFAGGTGTGGGVTQGAVAIGLSGATNWKIVNDTQASGNCAQMWIYNYAASSAKPLQSVSGGVSAGYRGSGYMGFTDYASAITTFTVTLSAGTFSAGTLKVYGVK